MRLAARLRAVAFALGIGSVSGAAAGQLEPTDALLATTTVGEVRVAATSGPCRPDMHLISDLVAAAVVDAGVHAPEPTESNSTVSVTLASRAAGTLCALHLSLKLVRNHKVAVPLSKHDDAEVPIPLFELGELVVVRHAEIRQATEASAWNLATAIADEVLAARDRVVARDPHLRHILPVRPPRLTPTAIH